MRKRKASQNMPRLDFMPDPVILPKWNTNIILRLLTRDFHSLSYEERELLMALVLLIRNKFDPDDYDVIFRLLSNNSIILNIPHNLSSIIMVPRPAGDTAPTTLVSGDLSQLHLPKKSKRTKSEKKATPAKRPLTTDTPQSIADNTSNELPELTAEEYLPFTFD